MDTKTARRNLGLVKWYRSLLTVHLLLPVFVLVAGDKGVTLGQIFLAQGILSAVALVCEIPSGWFGDQIGYKQSVLVGVVLITVGYSFLNLDGFGGLAIAFGLTGVGFGFAQGIDQTLAYDTLRAIITDPDELEKEYGEFQSSAQRLVSFLGAGLCICGGVLAAYSYVLLINLQVVVTGVSIILAACLIEPPHRKERKKAPTLRAAVLVSLGEMKKGIDYALRQRPKLRWLIFFSSIMAAISLAFQMLSQVYLATAGLPVWLFGAMGAAIQFMTGWLAPVAKWLLKLGLKRALICLTLVITATFLVLGISVSLFLMPVFLGYCFLAATWRTVVDVHMQKEVDGDQNIRATVMSVKGVGLHSAHIFFGMPFGAGLMADWYALQGALLVVAIVGGLLCGGVIMGLAKHERTVQSAALASE